jgi:two-component system cell cycle sensor histidine kinase PleC
MFSNLRYITIVVFGFLVILTLLAGVYLKHNFVSTIIKHSSEDESTFISNTLSRTVWNRFYPMVANLYKLPREQWDLYPQFILFKNEVHKIFDGNQQIIKVKIHQPDSSIIFDSNPEIEISTKPSIFNNFGNELDEFNDVKEVAETGDSKATILSQTIIKNGNTTVKKTILRSLTPLIVSDVVSGTEESARHATAVLEVNYDINNNVRKLETFQFTIVFIVICALSILTGAIFIASQKAEAVLDKQQEASLEMAAAKASAEAESRAKSQFLANVSHELRTPLNAIIGFSEIINSESMGPIANEQYKDFVKDIHTSGVHLLSLINDILDFSKTEENKLLLDFENIDVSKLSKICNRIVMQRAEDSKVKLTEELPSEHLFIKADGKRLKQTMINLLSNAIKFTPEGGTVTFKAWKDIDQNHAVIEIIDTGVGMAAQDLTRALAPFGQVDNKLSRKYEGTGLGLPLTKKLVELMNGKFDIISEPGMGTTVILTFPIVDV